MKYQTFENTKSKNVKLGWYKTVKWQNYEEEEKDQEEEPNIKLQKTKLWNNK